jgi:hypothetical protein
LSEITRQLNQTWLDGAKGGKPLPAWFGYLLKAAKKGRYMKSHNITVSGFRSTFRVGVTEQTSFQRELAESSLVHVLGNETEAAGQKKHHNFSPI